MNSFVQKANTARPETSGRENSNDNENQKYEFPASVRLLNDPDFKSRLVEQLKYRLALAPDAQKYQSLTDVYRRSGDIQLAADTAKAWATFTSNDAQALHFSKLLSQQPLNDGPFTNADVQPAPFTIINSFLSTQEREYFWHKATAKNAAYKHAGVSKDNDFIMDRSGRKTDVLKLDEQEKHTIRGKVSALVEPMCTRFGLPLQKIKMIEVKITAHREGGFFKIHQDGFQNCPENGTRFLSWVYYFHAQPKPYQGGDLVLFDSTCDPSHHICNPLNYTRYTPADNQLIIFPSWFYHGVTPVKRLQESPYASRFAVAGHVRC